MKRLAVLLLVAVMVVVAVLALPRAVHPRLEAELSRSLGQPVHFNSLRLRSTGAELDGLHYGDFLTAREVDAVIDWSSFDLHPQKLVLKGVEMRLDTGVLQALRGGRKSGKPRRFPLIFEDGRLLLFGVADISPLRGEWDTDNRLVLDHPVGGRWTLAHGKLAVERASLLALAGWLHQELPLDPGLLGSGTLAFGTPLTADLNLPWGDLKVRGNEWTSQRLGPFTRVEMELDWAGHRLEAQAYLGRDQIRGVASWRTGRPVGELTAARVALGEVELGKVDFDLRGPDLHGTLGRLKFRRLVTGPAELSLRLFPELDGELRFVQPLSLEAAQEAGLAPRIGINLGGVQLRAIRFGGSLLAPRITPEF